MYIKSSKTRCKYNNNIFYYYMSLGLVNTLSFFSPIIISCSVLIFSIFSLAIGKGLFYIYWLLVATFIRIGILWLIPGSNPKPTYKNQVCSNGDFLPYDNTTYSLFVLSFTFFYFTLPMYISNNINYLVIIFFITYIVFDILIKMSNYCIESSINVFGDIVAGAGLGASISAFIYSSPMSNYLFTNELSSNKETCSMPSKQTFKCSVYKNGELVNSTTA